MFKIIAIIFSTFKIFFKIVLKLFKNLLIRLSSEYLSRNPHHVIIIIIIVRKIIIGEEMIKNTEAN
jgi:hypothetical protein